MAEEITSELITDIISAYNGLLAALPSWAQNFVNLFLLVILLVGFCVIIWKFYTVISRKNIFRLNLNKYNKAGHSIWEKALAGLLYFLEYVIIIPFLIFFWFVFFTLFLILMTEMEMGTILIISAVCISAIRMTAYYKEDLSKELAIMLTLDLLVFAILTQGLFSIERIIGNFAQLPVFFNSIIIYFLFIVCLEVIMRFLDFVFSFFGLEKEGEEKEA